MLLSVQLTLILMVDPILTAPYYNYSCNITITIAKKVPELMYAKTPILGTNYLGMDCVRDLVCSAERLSDASCIDYYASYIIGRVCPIKLLCVKLSSA